MAELNTVYCISLHVFTIRLCSSVVNAFVCVKGGMVMCCGDESRGRLGEDVDDERIGTGRLG
jgi:hypothetical protein